MVVLGEGPSVVVGDENPARVVGVPEEVFPADEGRVVASALPGRN